MSDSDRSDTNWTGTYESNWTNTETDEVIEFRKEQNAIEVWIRNPNSKRAQLFSIRSTRKDAIERAHELADRFNTTAWWD